MACRFQVKHLSMEQDEIFRIAGFVYRQLIGELSEAEHAEIEKWATQSAANRQVLEELLKGRSWTRMQIEEQLYSPAKAYGDFKKRKQKQLRKLRVRRIGWSVAAMLVIGIGSLFFMRPGDSPQPTSLAVITPGESKAFLTLSDGRQVQLSGEMSDTVVYRRETSVIIRGGKIEYPEKMGELPERTVYDELFVPRKGEFMLTLEDGSKVWLNAESRIKYPVRFTENERRVYLKGEAYFEVAHDTSRPFIVDMQKATVQVLGTSFNVRAYKDEPNIYATLTEGKIRFSFEKQTVVLWPEEQGCADLHSGKITKGKVDVRLFTGWKDGRFIFQEQSLEEIMNTLARWYDVNVFFQSTKVREMTFSGNLKRYDNFDRIIKMLEMTGMARFQVHGNTILISE